MTEQSPDQNRMIWRAINAADEAALKELDRACKALDGEEPVSNLTGDALKAALAFSDNALCVAVRDQLAASAWAAAAAIKGNVQRIQLGGRVRPEFRRRGIGEAILAWAESRALQLAQPGATLQLFIANEALTEDANKLYLDYGYENTFSELMLVRPLDDQLPYSQLSEGLVEHEWNDASAPQFFQAYAAGFRDRLGDVVPVEDEWIAGYAAEDEDFRPDLSRVVLDREEPVGFVTCEVAGETGWISQIAVVQERRRKGLAHALVGGALQRLKLAGCREAALHVNANNARAQAVFFDTGFNHRLIRAKFIKEIMMPK
jgi:ribosomal protein S18 acetylase RimI-like enzyme